jgi:hypothetical protein
MKTMTMIGTLTIALAGSVFAESASCNMPADATCSMMPSSRQNSRENVTWIAPACCKPAQNISADVSSQNSRQAVLSSGRSTAKIGAIANVYAEKGSQVFVREVEVR